MIGMKGGRTLGKKTVPLRPRFVAEADWELRERIYRRGELAKLVVLILKTVDLTTIPLLELGSDIRSLAQTTVELPLELHGWLRRVATKRGTSMNAIVNSAIVAYGKNEKDQRL